MTLDFLSQPCWQRLSLVLVHFVWQGLAVAVVLAAVMVAWRPRSAQSRYAAYLIAFLALPACALATLAVTTISPPMNPASADATAIDPAAHGPDRSAGAVSVDRADSPSAAGNTVAGKPPLSPHDTPAANRADSTHGSNRRSTRDLRPEISAGEPLSHTLQAWRSALATWLSRLRPWLIAGWLAGLGLFSLRLVLGAVVIAWIVHRAGDVRSELLAAARRLSVRLGVRAPRIVASCHVRQALAAGLFRPVIVLPAAWATGLSPEMAEAVLAHELAHLRRYDVWLNFVQRLVETVFFYHPVVWWLSARVRAERELCCDDMAVAATGDRLGYATALELAAGGPCPARDLLLANGIGGRKMAVLERVRRVLNLETDAGRQRWWPGGVAALAVPALVWCASAAWQPVLADGDDVALVQDEEGENAEAAAREEVRRAEQAARQVDEERRRNREAAERQREAAERNIEGAQRNREAAERERDRQDRGDFEPRNRERGPRDGETPEARGPRDGERPGRFDPFDGGRPNPYRRPDRERPDGDRPRDPRQAEPDTDRWFAPRGDLPPAQRELLELVRQLRQEVEELRREVRELRDSRPRGPIPGGPFGPPRLRDGEPREREDGERGEFRGPPRRPDPPAGPFGSGRNPFSRRPDRDPTDRERDDREREREDGEREVPERDAEDRRPDREQDRDREAAHDVTPPDAFYKFYLGLTR